MGANFSYSENVAESIVKSGITAATNYTQTCAGRIKSAQTITLNNCTLNASSIDISNVEVGVVQCLQDVSNQENIRNAVEQAVKQAADAAVQQGGIADIGRISENIAINMTKIESDITTAIVTNFTQTCTSDLQNSQKIDCNNSQINLTGPLTVSNYQQSLTDCTFKAVSQTDAYNQLKQVIEQSATAKEESIFSIYVIIGLVIIAIVAIFVLNAKRNVSGIGATRTGAVGSSRNTWIVIGIVIIICIAIVVYALMASSNGWWPFESTKPLSTGYQVS